MTLNFTKEQITTIHECLGLAIKSPSVNLDGARVITDLYTNIASQLDSAVKEKAKSDSTVEHGT